MDSNDLTQNTTGSGTQAPQPVQMPNAPDTMLDLTQSGAPAEPQPAMEETSIAEPETAQSEIAEPQAVEPQIAEPETIEPAITEPIEPLSAMAPTAEPEMAAEESEVIGTKPEVAFDDSAFDPNKKKGVAGMMIALSTKKPLTIVLLVIFVLAISASGFLGYSVMTKTKALKDKEVAVVAKEEEVKIKDAKIKKLETDLAASVAATAAAVAAATPAPVATPTTTKKSTSTSTQETVIAPPAPPS